MAGQSGNPGGDGRRDRSCRPRPWPFPGAPVLGALRTAPDLEAARAAAGACLSPAGQLQVAVTLTMPGALEARLEVLRHELLHAARSLTGAKVLAGRLYGVGPVGS